MNSEGSIARSTVTSGMAGAAMGTIGMGMAARMTMTPPGAPPLIDMGTEASRTMATRMGMADGRIMVGAPILAPRILTLPPLSLLSLASP